MFDHVVDSTLRILSAICFYAIYNSIYSIGNVIWRRWHTFTANESIESLTIFNEFASFNFPVDFFDATFLLLEDWTDSCKFSIYIYDWFDFVDGIGVGKSFVRYIIYCNFHS